jgi:hypothetical protein
MPRLRITVAASRIELWPVGRLIRWERQHRSDPEAGVEEVPFEPCGIAKFLGSGMTAPLLLDETGIVAGRDRLAAARQLQLGELPVIPLMQLSSDEREVYLQRDRELAKVPPFDDAELRRELAELAGDGFEGMLGFSEAELAALAVAGADLELPEC